MFFKIMHEDAKRAAGPMDLKLFVTGEASCPMPVYGFPKSGLDRYVGKLVRAGFAVAGLRSSSGRGCCAARGQRGDPGERPNRAIWDEDPSE